MGKPKKNSRLELPMKLRMTMKETTVKKKL